MQSLLREAMLKHYGMSTGHYTAVAVILNGQRYLESTALLNVMQRSGHPFDARRLFMPHLWRGYLYRWVALNCYQLFWHSQPMPDSFCRPSAAFLEYIIHAKI